MWEALYCQDSLEASHLDASKSSTKIFLLNISNFVSDVIVILDKSFFII